MVKRKGNKREMKWGGRWGRREKEREREKKRERERRDSLEECHGLLLKPVIEVIFGHGADVPVAVLRSHLA